MTEVILLRLNAPLMSFGGPAIDNHRFTLPFPGRALLTGILANALGYCHGEFAKLDALQRRIRYAVRRDREGVALLDYQTVALGEDHVDSTGWTTRGRIEGRVGGSAKQTHIRYCHYLANAVYTVALALRSEAEGPSLDAIEAALREPARPLFIGRKCCVPATPLLLGRSSAETMAGAVMDARNIGEGTSHNLLAWWPDEVNEPPGQIVPVTDDRDWANQIYVGRRFMRQNVFPAHAGINPHLEDRGGGPSKLPRTREDQLQQLRIEEVGHGS